MFSKSKRSWICHLVLVFVVSSSSMIQAQLPSARTTPTSKTQGIQVNMERPILCPTPSTNVLTTFVGWDWILRLSIQWLQQILLKKQLDQLHMLAMILWQSLLLQANPFQNFVEIWLDNTVWTIDNSIASLSTFIIFSVYVDLGSGASDSATLALAFQNANTNRKWDIKVAQIPCGATYA